MQLGLVTYLWGAEWDIPTLLRHCREAGIGGVELRVDHKHGVSPALDAGSRARVAGQFGEAGVTLVGLGTNFEFHSPDPDKLQANLDGAMQWIQLAHDVGATGVKVKPNDLPAGAPVDETIRRIGRSLNLLAEHAEGFGIQVRLEVHGKATAPLPIIKKIMDVADHPGVAVCWNSNPSDLQGDGLEANFKLVQDRLGDTTHIHELDDPKYPWARLFALLKAADYSGWTLLECATKPADPVAALKSQRELWRKLVEG
jgi:sugar phosphate isomerase/epimerase